jgi:hypothetical protein
MKAIIRGKRYDTEKATLIGKSGSNGHISITDFSWWEAGLYRTPRSGTYFLAGEGGPMTMFAHSVGNGRTGGSRIIEMDVADALDWAERHLTTAEVEAAFSDQVEDA